MTSSAAIASAAALASSSRRSTAGLGPELAALAGDGGGGDGNLGASTRSAALARSWSSRARWALVLALDHG